MSKWKHITKWHENELQKSFQKLEHKTPTTQVPQIAIVTHRQCTTKQVMRMKCKSSNKNQSKNMKEKSKNKSQMWKGTKSLGKWKCVVAYNLEMCKTI